MVEVLQLEPKINHTAQAMQGFGSALGSVNRFVASKQQEKEQEIENQDIEEITGIKMPRIKDEGLRKIYLQEQLKKKETAAKLKGDEEQFKKDYESYSKIFGKKFTDLWEASNPGARTELVREAWGAVMRGEDIEEKLNNIDIPKKPNKKNDIGPVPQMKNGKIPDDFDWPDYSKPKIGYTTKSWEGVMKEWRKENSPIYLKNKEHLANNKKDAIAIRDLKRLNKEMPNDFSSRMLIDPETGDFYKTAQKLGLVPASVQEWQKTIARFQNRAKDAFGSRVTNFDLVSYMKQFPSLLNTEEGRERILRAMDINNQLDFLHETALQEVYRKYELDGIPFEAADKLAQQLIQDETDRLTAEYFEVENEMQELGSQEIGKKIDVFGPDGKLYEMDEIYKDQLPEGYKIKGK